MDQYPDVFITEESEAGIPDCCGGLIKTCLENGETSILIGCEQCGTFWWIFLLNSISTDEPELDSEFDDEQIESDSDEEQEFGRIQTGFIELNQAFFLKKANNKNVVLWVRSHKAFYTN